MAMSGLWNPNYGQMGMESGIPTGTGAAIPYGQAEPTSASDNMGLSPQTPSQDSAQTDIGYSRYTPRIGYADRLSANIVGGPSADNMDGGMRNGGASKV